MYFGSKTVEIVDLSNERTVTQITLDDMPKDADLDYVNNMAYVASANAGTIYMIDLNSAKLSKAIKLEQSPEKIAIADDGKSFSFYRQKHSKNLQFKRTRWFLYCKIYS